MNKLRCPRCKKKSFSTTKKEDGSKLWYCYMCKYYKVTGEALRAETSDAESKEDEMS